MEQQVKQAVESLWAELPPWFAPAACVTGGIVLLYCYHRGSCTDLSPPPPPPLVPPGVGKYVLTGALPSIGSRVQKFLMLGHFRAEQTTELLFTMIPVSNLCTANFPDCLAELSATLQHIRENVPYCHPVVEVLYTKAYNRVVIVEPFIKHGSLKDMIYKTEPEVAWEQKYTQTSEGLPAERVSLYGWHLLEAMMYLYEKGFPPLGHVTSGNVFVVGEVCRLGGYENTLLGYKTRLYKLFKDHPEHIDVLMFGHLLFEMAAGYELTTTAPTEGDYDRVQEKDSQICEELLFIFETDHEGVYVQKIEDIHKRPFFALNDTSGALTTTLSCVKRDRPADNHPDPTLSSMAASASTLTPAEDARLTELRLTLEARDCTRATGTVVIGVRDH